MKNIVFYKNEPKTDKCSLERKYSFTLKAFFDMSHPNVRFKPENCQDARPHLSGHFMGSLKVMKNLIFIMCKNYCLRKLFSPEVFHVATSKITIRLRLLSEFNTATGLSVAPSPVPQMKRQPSHVEIPLYPPPLL